MLNDDRPSNVTTETDTNRDPVAGKAAVLSDGRISVGQRVRFVGNPQITTWNKPCIGVTGRLTRRNVSTSRFTGNEVVLWVFEPEVRGKCLPPWMYVSAGDVRRIGEDVPSQGEASLMGDCSYDAMLRKAGIDQSFLHGEYALDQVAIEASPIC